MGLGRGVPLPKLFKILAYFLHKKDGCKPARTSTHKSVRTQTCTMPTARRARASAARNPPLASSTTRKKNCSSCATSCCRGAWQPGAYHSFYIHDPKRRLISAAPFRDRRRAPRPVQSAGADLRKALYLRENIRKLTNLINEQSPWNGNGAVRGADIGQLPKRWQEWRCRSAGRTA